jgi:hypothetical protein
MVSGGGLARQFTHGGPQVCSQHCRLGHRVSGVFHSLSATGTGKDGYWNEYRILASIL